MLNKLKTFLKWRKDFGFSNAMELALKWRKDFGFSNAMKLVLSHLGFKIRIILKKKLFFNYPNTSLSIGIDQGPIDFWKSLEQESWEIELIRFINDLVKPGETILDVGAWVGPLTFLFSHLVGENGSVYAFEPNPESFSILEHYVTNNKSDNIYLYKKAISNVVGFIKLYSPSQISRSASIRNHFEIQKSSSDIPEFKYEWKCDCTTIDEFCLTQDIRPDGIKIDVEGTEMNVLNGASKIIEKYKPWCLLEFHGHLLSELERQRIWSFITDRATKIIYIEGNEKDLTYKMEVSFHFKPTKRSNYCILFK